MYRKAAAKKFPPKSRWKSIFTKKISFGAIGVVVAGLMVIVGNNLLSNKTNFTVEMLINKAQAAAELKSTQGKYYYQKLKIEEGAKGSTILTPMIEEFWEDPSTKDFLVVTSDPSNNKLTQIELFQKGIVYMYSADGLLTSESQDNGEALRLANLNVNEMMQKKLKQLFDKEAVDLNEFVPTGMQVSSFEIGEKEWENKKIKFLDLEDKNNVQKISLYFDPQTFDLLYGEVFNNQLQRTVESTRVLNSEFSDTVPLIEVGSNIIGLEKPATQHAMKTFENKEMKFQYPDFYTLEEKGETISKDGTKEQNIQLTRENSKETITILITQGEKVNPIESNAYIEIKGKKFYRVDDADGYSYNLFYQNKQFTFFSTLPDPDQYPFNDSLELLMQSLELK